MSTPVHGISKTSIYVAAGRAVGAREPDPSVRNPDFLAEQLLGDPAALGVDHPAVRALSLAYDAAICSAMTEIAIEIIPLQLDIGGVMIEPGEEVCFFRLGEANLRVSC